MSLNLDYNESNYQEAIRIMGLLNELKTNSLRTNDLDKSKYGYLLEERGSVIIPKAILHRSTTNVEFLLKEFNLND
jgi:hypothetical protein